MERTTNLNTRGYSALTVDRRKRKPRYREGKGAVVPESTDSGCGHDREATGDPERLLTIHEVANWVGVSVSTLYQRSSRREGPNRLKIGGVLRYKRCCVAAWIDEQMVTSRE